MKHFDEEHANKVQEVLGNLFGHGVMATIGYVMLIYGPFFLLCMIGDYCSWFFYPDTWTRIELIGGLILWIPQIIMMIQIFRAKEKGEAWEGFTKHVYIVFTVFGPIFGYLMGGIYAFLFRIIWNIILLIVLFLTTVFGIPDTWYHHVPK